MHACVSSLPERFWRYNTGGNEKQVLCFVQDGELISIMARMLRGLGGRRDSNAVHARVLCKLKLAKIGA